MNANDLVKVADAEWKHWGKSTWNCITGAKSKGFHVDDEDTFAQYVIDTYLPPFYKPTAKWPGVNTIADDDYAWSAVTISYFMLEGGFKRKALLPDKLHKTKYGDWVKDSKPDEFPASESHSQFIRWAIRARKDNIGTAAYWGYRIDDKAAVPAVGDLVAYARGKGMTAAKAQKYFDKTGSYESHSDLVVAVRKGEIDVIGGNVRESVTKKTLSINAKGQLTDTAHNWFAVLRAN